MCVFITLHLLFYISNQLNTRNTANFSIRLNFVFLFELVCAFHDFLLNWNRKKQANISFFCAFFIFFFFAIQWAAIIVCIHSVGVMFVYFNVCSLSKRKNKIKTKNWQKKQASHSTLFPTQTFDILCCAAYAETKYTPAYRWIDEWLLVWTDRRSYVR